MSVAAGSRRRDWLFDLAAVVLLWIQFALLLLFPLVRPKQFGDEFFHSEAKTLASVIRGEVGWDSIRIERAPGPVVFYAIPYALFSPDDSDENRWTAAILWSGAWMGLSMVLLRRSARWLGGETAGIAAMFLVLATPLIVYYTFGILAECLAYLSVCLWIFGWSYWITHPPNRASMRGMLALLAACLGMTGVVLARPNAALVYPMGVGAASLLWWKHRGTGEVRSHLVFLTVTLVTSIALFLGASQLVGRLPSNANRSPQVEVFGLAFMLGRFQFRTEPWDWRHWSAPNRVGSRDYADYLAAIEELKGQEEIQGVPYERLKFDYCLRDIRDNPLLNLRMTLTRSVAIQVAMINSRRIESFRLGPIDGLTVFTSVHFLINSVMLLTLFGSIWFVMTDRRASWYWVLWTPWIALWLFHAVVYAENRYLHPSRPCTILMTALVFASALETWKSRKSAMTRRAGTPVPGDGIDQP